MKEINPETRERASRVQLVLLDVSEPNGISLLEEIRRTDSDVCVIAMTGLATVEAAVRDLLGEALRDRVPTVESSEYKLYMNELGQRVADWALDLLGPAGQLRCGEEATKDRAQYDRLRAAACAEICAPSDHQLHVPSPIPAKYKEGEEEEERETGPLQSHPDP